MKATPQNNHYKAFDDIKSFLKPQRVVTLNQRKKAKKIIIAYIKNAGFQQPYVISSHCLNILDLTEA